MHGGTKVKVAAGILAVTMLTAGCLGGSSSKKATSAAPNGGLGTTSAPGTVGGNKNTSKTITIMLGFSGPQLQAFEGAVDPYAKSQGITIKWAPSTDFNNQIILKVKANQVPDIALFPQPGIMQQVQKTGKLAPLDSFLDIPSLKKQMVTGIMDSGTVGGKVYAIPPSINVKSLVFYPKQAWAADQLTAPTTLQGLLDLSAKLKSEGKTPWCMGTSSPPATGWPATDWIENLVLDYGGAAKYQQWVNHAIKFNSPLVNEAATYYSKIFSTPGWVDGGQHAISGIPFGTAGNPMFQTKPGCYMFKQGNFIAQSGFFPANILKNLDSNVGLFQFPGVTASSKPVEGGGDLAALFSGNNAAAKTILKFMFTPTFGTSAAKLGGYISPFNAFPQADYPNDLTRQMANIAYKATSFAFDASDQMPAAVGSGTFWTEMTKWISGSENQQAALKAIDASWPTS